MDLRPMNYQDVCPPLTNTQSGNGGVGGVGGSLSDMPVASIMVLPSSLVPPGGAILQTAPETTPTPGQHHHHHPYEHYYQLQPTDVLLTTSASASATATATKTAAAAASSTADIQSSPVIVVDADRNPDGQCNSCNIISSHSGAMHASEPVAFLLAQRGNNSGIGIGIQQQQQQQEVPPPPPPVSIAQHAQLGLLQRSNTLKKLVAASPVAIPLTRKSLESANLSSRYQLADAMTLKASAGGIPVAVDESDFDGSECGGSVSSTTCIPHFRFGGCGMILQSALVSAGGHYHQQQQQQQQQQHHRQDLGCPVSMANVMASQFTVASRDGTLLRPRPKYFDDTFMGTNAGGGGGSGGGGGGGGGLPVNGTIKMRKHVSFDEDNLSQAEILSDIHKDKGHLNADAFNNCSFMQFDNIMDYQNPSFGGLPDVTEHLNARCPLSSSSGDIGRDVLQTNQKSKADIYDGKSSSSSLSLSSPSSNAGKRKSKAVDQHEQRRNGKYIPCILGLTLAGILCLFATLTCRQFLIAPGRNSHSQRLRTVKRILHEVPLVDGHNNFAWNVRKYAHNSLEAMNRSHNLIHKSLWTRQSWAQTDMERLKIGLVGVQVWSAYVPCEAQGLDAVQLALEQIDIIRRLPDMYAEETMLVTSSKEIAAARRHGLMSSLIGIEGGHAIGSSLGVLRSFYSLGARYLSLTHKCDVSWASSSVSLAEKGLSQFGKAIVREMNRLGMIINLSYSSDRTARDVLLVTRAPVIFSHSAARHLCNSTRNIPDDILRLVAENGGLIMISFDSEDVACGRQANLKDVVDHINYVRFIAGVQHIGLGAGYDSIELPPIGLEDVSKYPDLLVALLEDSNWSEEDIAMLAGKNFLRIMETVENVRDYWKRAAIQPVEQTEPNQPNQPSTQCAYMSL